MEIYSKSGYDYKYRNGAYPFRAITEIGQIMRKSIPPERMHELEVALAAAYVHCECTDVSEAEANERAEVIVTINEARLARGVHHMPGPTPFRMSVSALRQVLLADIEVGTRVAA